MNTCPAALSHITAPKIKVPTKSCDCHAHIFDDGSQYPFSSERNYTPPAASLAEYLHLHRKLGIERGVLVQPSVYGSDNRLLIDSLQQLTSQGLDYRGVAVISPDTPDSQLDILHQAGVRGVRMNLLFQGGINLDDIFQLAPRLQLRGWHIQLLVDLSTFDQLENIITNTNIPIVIDHMGHIPASKGILHQGFQELIRLLANDRIWVKLSGGYRFTNEATAPYRDVDIYAQKLLAAKPDCMLWGSDWPHPQIPVAMPDDGILFNQTLEWLNSESLRKQVLVDNPHQLYFSH